MSLEWMASVAAVLPDMTPGQKRAVWRYAITGAVVLLWAFAVYANSEFARSSDLERIEIMLIESRIDQLRRRQCVALDEENRLALQVVWPQLSLLRARYYELTNREYPLPSCTEL